MSKKKRKKPKSKNRKRLGPLSLYPLKPEDALRAFMAVKPRKNGLLKG
jgi:hypothetical protein